MIKNFTEIAHPLTELLRNNPSAKSLNASRQSFDNCPTLILPSPRMTNYHLVTNSSNLAVDAALYQMVNCQPIPMGFYSIKLSDAQKVYTTYDRELLAASLAVLHFKTLFDGHSVSLFLDHKHTVSAFYSKSVP